MSYDIIGDIHGQADKLRTLLHKLGYREHSGAWQHPDRTAIFVGDFIDRGPHQLETVNIVRRMVDGGHALAVMGNHEFNAIAWYLEDPVQEGEHLRPHSGEVGEKTAANMPHFWRKQRAPENTVRPLIGSSPSPSGWSYRSFESFMPVGIHAMWQIWRPS